MLKRSLFIFAGVTLLWVVVNLVRIRILAARAGVHISNTKPFEQKGSSGKKVLILGDSVAYGTGASTPDKSVAGLIVNNHYPKAHVTNLAKNGMRTSELAQHVETLDQHYDLIFIIIGGNDILRPWVSIEQSGKNLQAIYVAASGHADKVIALTTGNLKYTTFYLPPLNYYFGNRSVSLRDRAVNAATGTKVEYVNIIDYNERVGFESDMEADDHLHLSDKGVQYWYEEIKRVANLR